MVGVAPDVESNSRTNSVELLPILLPFLTPIFAKLFKGCDAPASGQREDPKAELLANMTDGHLFRPEFIKRSRLTTKKAMRRANRGKHRRDPSFVAVNNASADAATVEYFEHVLASPDVAVKAGYLAGCGDMIGTKADMAGVE
jgi:hypothetical protein